MGYKAVLACFMYVEAECDVNAGYLSLQEPRRDSARFLRGSLV